MRTCDHRIRRGIAAAGRNLRSGFAYVLGAFAVIAALLGPRGRALLDAMSTEEAVRATRSEARAVEEKVRAYRASHPGECPDDARVHAKPVRDAWGRRMRVQCGEGDVIVWSAGPDGRFGTPDDV